MRLNSLCAVALMFLSAVNSALSQSHPIKFGALFSLTGFGASAGNDDLRGVLLAQEEINAAGGIAGNPVQIITEDFKSDLKSTATGFLKLASIDKVAAIIGPNYSEFVEVAIPAADKHKVPTIATSGYPSATIESRQPGFYGFVMWPPLAAALEPLLEKVLASGAKRVVILAAQNRYYEELSQIAVKRLSSSGITVEKISVQPDMLDFKSIILGLKRKSPDALISFLLETGQIGSFFKQSRSLGFKTPLFSDGHLTDDKTLTADLELANGVIFFQYDISSSPSFKEKFIRRYSSQPAFTAAKGYDALYALKSAIERCGSLATQIRDCLAKTEWQGASGSVKFNKHGALDDRGRYTKLYTIVDSKVQELKE